MRRFLLRWLLIRYVFYPERFRKYKEKIKKASFIHNFVPLFKLRDEKD